MRGVRPHSALLAGGKPPKYSGNSGVIRKNDSPESDSIGRKVIRRNAN